MTGSLKYRFLTSIGRRLFSIGLNLHSSGDSEVGFSSREIGHVDESVVEGGKEMDDSENVLVLSSTGLRGSVVGNLLFLDNGLLRGLNTKC